MALTRTSPISTLSDAEIKIYQQVREDVVEAIKLYEASNSYLHILSRNKEISFDICAIDIVQSRSHRQSSVQLPPTQASLEQLNAAIDCVQAIAWGLTISHTVEVPSKIPTLRYVVTVIGLRPQID